MAGIRDHESADGAQPGEDFARFGKAPHMNITGGETPVWHRELGSSWIARSSFGTASSKRHAKKCAWPIMLSAVPTRTRGLSRSAVSTCFDRDVGLAGVQPEDAADMPAAREIRVERQGALDERHHGAD